MYLLNMCGNKCPTVYVWRPQDCLRKPVLPLSALRAPGIELRRSDLAAGPFYVPSHLANPWTLLTLWDSVCNVTKCESPECVSHSFKQNGVPWKKKIWSPTNQLNRDRPSRLSSYFVCKMFRVTFPICPYSHFFILFKRCSCSGGCCNRAVTGSTLSLQCPTPADASTARAKQTLTSQIHVDLGAREGSRRPGVHC